MSGGWVKLHRKFLDWEWYSDPNTLRLFLHLLLTANHKDNKWKGVAIKAGQVATSRGALAERLRLSEQQIRTCLNKLKKTKEITTKVTNKYSIITLVNYKAHQISTSKATIKQPAKNQQPNQHTPKKQPANNQPAPQGLTKHQPINNQQITNKQPASNQQSNHKQEVKNDKNVRRKRKKDKRKKNPHIEQVVAYLNKKSGKNFSPTTEQTCQHINARLGEGFSVEDFFYVIDVKCDEWMLTEGEQWIRPNTLFCPTHFEEYLNQKRKSIKSWAERRKDKEAKNG